MKDFEDELRTALRRENPPPDFADRVIASLPGEVRADPSPMQVCEAPRRDVEGERTFSLIARALRAARYYAAPRQRTWAVHSLAGAPKVGAERVNPTGRIAVGDWLETDRSSRAKIDVGGIGYVEVEPESRLRLIAARLRDHRFALLRGSLRATIWAPPRLFFVETPSATAIDLGCAYTLRVDEGGSSFLHVTSGWVSLALAGRVSVVPAGALCETRPGAGPGTPYFADAPEKLCRALAKLDFGDRRAEGRAAALDVVLAEARDRDALSLWHLLSRTEGNERARVYDRLSSLVEPPKGVARSGVLALDRKMLGSWQQRLELDWFRNDPLWRKAWRRMWKRSWRPEI